MQISLRGQLFSSQNQIICNCTLYSINAKTPVPFLFNWLRNRLYILYIVYLLQPWQAWFFMQRFSFFRCVESDNWGINRMKRLPAVFMKIVFPHPRTPKVLVNYNYSTTKVSLDREKIPWHKVRKFGKKRNLKSAMKTSCTNIHVCGTTLVIARNLFSSHKPEEKKWGKK